MEREPAWEPREPKPAAVCGCGCEVYAGREAWEGVADGYVYMEDPGTGRLRSYCVDCFVYELTQRLKRRPYDAARYLRLEYRETGREPACPTEY